MKFTIAIDRKPLVAKLATVLLLSIGLMLVLPEVAQAKKPKPCFTCLITGSNPATAGQTYTYYLSGCTGGASTWTTTCGTVQSFDANSVTIYFAACSSATIIAHTTGGTLATTTITLNPAAALTGGAISNAFQVINQNTVPAPISASVATGGTCGTSYSYQWYSSTDNVNFSIITGATGQNYQPGSVAVTTYYKRQTTCIGLTAWTTNTATASVLQSGTLTPTTQYINYNTAPGALSVSPPSGTDGGTLSYTWYGNNLQINGPTNSSYTPGALTSTTYYQVVTWDASVGVGSSPVYVYVYPQVVPGTISPPNQATNYNTSPATMTISAPSGGNGSYSYQWYSNATGVFQAITGATGMSYTPGILTAGTSYEVVVNSNGAMQTSVPAVVSIVLPPLTPGTLTPGTENIVSGTAPGVLYCNPATGGIPGNTYAYQWQSSPDGTNWSNITGVTGLSYSPPSLSATTYYQIVVTCGTQTANTNAAQIKVGAANSDWSYVRTRDITRPGIFDLTSAGALTDPNDVKQVTQYVDGLGRSLQGVAMQASPLGKDMVTFNVYDAQGREADKYLPYTATTTDGNYKTTAIQDQTSFNSNQYPAEHFYHGEVDFEPSPANRVATTYAPGVRWLGADRGVGMQYLLNALTDSVHVWNISLTPGALPTDGGPYAAGQLTKTVTTDENLHQVVEYKDKDRLTILKKVQLDPVPGNAHVGWLCTYYVYDDLDNLRFVISPRASEIINVAGTWTISQAVADELCFRYEYDSRTRMIVKKIPGAGEVHMVYDARDRVVMSQDSLLRSQHKWLYTRYDGINRNDSTGLLTDPTNYNNAAYHQNLASASTSYPTISSYTTELLTRSFYDNYTWVGAVGAPVFSTLNGAHLTNSYYFYQTTVSPIYGLPIVADYVTRGMVTGAMKKVIGTASQYLYNVSFFDDHGRTIQTNSNNYTGGKDTTFTQYNFAGIPLRQIHGNTKGGNTVQSHVVLTKMDYDPEYRLRHVYKLIDGTNTSQLIDSIQYDELGRVSAKYLGNNVDSVVYAYNIRGWLTGINKNYVGGTTNHWFGMELGYDYATSLAGTAYGSPTYNGNIAGTTWKSAGDGINRRYDYGYDNANRLQNAYFSQEVAGVFGRTSGGSNPIRIDFSTNGIAYDANGNIKGMTQTGFKVGGSVTIDQLTYTYQANSNKLSQVTDAANDTASVLGDFHYKGTKQAYDYKYDGNGSLSLDNNKAIDSIGYNYLNLPQYVHMKGKGTILYTYDAGGEKVQKQTIDSLSGLATTTLYLEGIQYQRRSPIATPASGTDTLQFLSTEEGRARWAFHKHLAGDSVYAFEYDFVERDHLGNTRVLLSQERDTAQYLATMEAAYRATENALFYNLSTSCVARSSVPAPGYPNDLTYTNPNDSVARVNGNGPKVGPAIILKVMSGDKVDIGVQYYYNSGTYTSAPPLSPQNLLNSLASGLATLSSVAGEGISALSNTTTSPLLAALTSSIGNETGTGTTKPQAYLNWMLLDNQFNYASGGAIQVGAAGQNGTNLQSPLAQLGIAMSKSGYLYIYVSNATPGWDVFFDNLSVKQYSGPMIEENHYYPFGLLMSGISDKAIKAQYQENKYRANGGDELQNKEFSDGSGLEAYDATFRMYDPQIGRFMQIDPLAIIAADYSPYSFVQDNPLSFSDPLGLTDSVVDVTNVGVKGVKAYAAAPVVTPGSSAPHKDVNAGIADTKGGGSSVSADPAPATVSSPIPGSQGSDNTAGNTDKGDHNIVTDIAYEINKFNLLAKVVDLGYTFFTGHDSYGVPQTKTGAVTNLAVTIPVFRAAEGVEIGANLIEQGLGSTGRTEAANLTEKLAMEEIKSNPALGARIANMKPLTDPRWQGWFKMTNRNAHGVEIHFNALIKDGVLTAVDDFKFK